MLNLKSIAATLAVMGTGAVLTACGGSQTKATEVPASQPQPGTASCAASGNCGAHKGESGCGANKADGGCGAKPEHACGAKPGAGSEVSCGAKPAEAAAPPPPVAVADTAPAAAASAAAPAPASKPAARGRGGKKASKAGEAACGEGSCA